MKCYTKLVWKLYGLYCVTWEQVLTVKNQTCCAQNFDVYKHYRTVGVEKGHIPVSAKWQETSVIKDLKEFKTPRTLVQHNSLGILSYI
jgi:hypothetical protein